MLGGHATLWTPRQGPFSPFAPNNIFVRDVTKLALASDQTPARKIANQLNYNNAGYTNWYGYTGPGHTTSGKTVGAQVGTFTITVWKVPPGQPTEKITFVDAEGKPQPPGESSNLQSRFEAVPVPKLASVPSGSLICPEGTDGWIVIIRGKEMWECWRFAGVEGARTMRYGGYIPDISTWNGIFPNNWGARATSLALMGGMISLQDIVEVLEAAKRGVQPTNYHALLLNAPVTSAGIGPVAPATRNDEKTNTPELYEGKPNPAFGNVDAVAESSWFRLPPTAMPGEYGITKPIETWIFECMRRCGWFVGDSAGQPAFDIESPYAGGSNFSWWKSNPYVPSSFGGGKAFTWIPSSWTDPALQHLEEGLGSENTRELFTNLLPAFANAELLAARSS